MSGLRTSLRVSTGVPYDVVIGAGVAEEVPTFVREVLPRVRKVAIVADENLDRLYASRVAASFEAVGLSVVRATFPAGEHSKTLGTYAEILGVLAANRLTRTDLAVALGGGVTGDLTGFVAATYLRGIDFLQLPTSLLAMVDSSVGGKTGVDLPEGKNLVGAFHQPRCVFCDTSFLATLPPAWERDGMGEVLKYAVLGDAVLFDRLESAPLTRIGVDEIVRCVEMKRAIVTRDEFELGERRLLNLGHTYGHAIERLSGYSVSHGTAVATGIACAARAAAAHGFLSASEAGRIVRLVGDMGYPVRSPCTAEDMLRAAAHDKKLSGGRLAFVVPTRIGACTLAEVPMEEAAGWFA